MKLVATCARGLERLLEREVKKLGLRPEPPGAGAVAFDGDWRDVWRANWWLRTANRVLVELGGWSAGDADRLYQGAYRLVSRWQGPLFSPDRTLAITASASASRQTDTRWLALRIKDAVVDAQRDRFGARSDVAREVPDLGLRLRLHRDRATLLLDTTGEPLDRRGYRLEQGPAPLRENLAAACVLAAGWDARGMIVDRMCGSGTLLAEAGMWALGIAPGHIRAPDGWAFCKLPDFDATAFAAIRAETVHPPAPRVRLEGSDRDPGIVEVAARNLERAGLIERAHLGVGDLHALPAPGPHGLLLLNPPYGDRLDEDRDQWRALGRTLATRYGGWTVSLLARDPEQERALGLAVHRRLAVFNGPLRANILTFKVPEA